MKAKWLRLAALMLDDAAEEFNRHGCNDWDWPEDWSPEERQEFARLAWDDDRQFEEMGTVVPDWLAMRTLAELLRNVKDDSGK